MPPFSQAAREALEQKVLNKRKRLDALKHTTRTQQRLLEELHLECQKVKKGVSAGTKPSDARTRKKEEDAMVVCSYVTSEICKYECVFHSW